MVDGILFLWFILAALSVVFVSVDVRHTPESPVLKWAFVLISAYAGPFGAFFYVLGCREPLPGLHARFVATRWRQVLGSTMHCVAGDGAGILAGAAIGSSLHLQASVHVALEYVLGFGFGWTIFQALFMRDMAGGSFTRSLRSTFIPEFLSMNVLMAGMLPTMMFLMVAIPGSDTPGHLTFWFIMSIALLVGAVVAYPMNWWLVAHHLKHGMMTIRRPEAAEESVAPKKAEEMPKMDHRETALTHASPPSTTAVVKMAFFSVLLFVLGIIIAVISGTWH
ncbi:MAG: DUF4396 domain-containing protein [Acidobacteria bacterium]|nr:MAG: DUF4396 domain-containing protein [Acidobacteriota bacterium]